MLQTHTEKKEARIRDLVLFFGEIDLAWGLTEVVNTQQSDFLIAKLANDKYIISDIQFANAKAWILNGDRTYMGRNSTKLLLADFSPTLKQLSTLESDSVRVLTKEELVLMLDDKFKEGQRTHLWAKPVKDETISQEISSYTERECIRLSMELLEKKEELKNMTKQRDNLISRVRNPSGMLMARLQGGTK